MTRVLIASCVRQDPTVLRAHLKTLTWQRLPAGVTVEYAFIDDNLDAESSTLLRSVEGARIFAPEPRPEGAQYEVNEQGHSWAIPTFYFLAREKQRLLDLTIREHFDAIFLVDSDLLLAPDTLSSLIATEKEIVSGVFWTSWSGSDAPLPQVWVTHPYGFEGAGWTTHTFLSSLRRRELVRVRGLGAATLIRSSAIRRGASFALVEGLPSWGMWQGEDRHFCVNAERRHIEMWADAWPQIYHVYRPSDRAHIDDVLAQLHANELAHHCPMTPDSCECGNSYCVKYNSPRDGDWVSLKIEPCEEPQLALHREHIRGKLGSLPLLPDIEDALFDMRPGDSRFVRARFPAETPIEEYRGRAKLLKLTLVSSARE